MESTLGMLKRQMSPESKRQDHLWLLFRLWVFQMDIMLGFVHTMMLNHSYLYTVMP